MILQCDEAFLAAHLLVVVDQGGEHHAVNLVDEFRALGDDLHRIPFVLLEM